MHLTGIRRNIRNDFENCEFLNIEWLPNLGQLSLNLKKSSDTKNKTTRATVRQERNKNYRYTSLMNASSEREELCAVLREIIP